MGFLITKNKIREPKFRGTEFRNYKYSKFDSFDFSINQIRQYANKHNFFIGHESNNFNLNTFGYEC